MTGILFVVLGILVIAGSAYIIISYAGDVMTDLVDFVTTNDFTKLQQCGLGPSSAQFIKMKTDVTTIIVPFIYVGLPLLLVVLSFLMFLGGFYYHKGRHEEEVKRNEQLERELLRKMVTNLERERAPNAGGMNISNQSEATQNQKEMNQPEAERPEIHQTKKRK